MRTNSSFFSIVGITVVIPLYNKECFIERTLDSVLNQLVLPSEIIVIDDGSTDDSYRRAFKKLQKQNIKFSIIRQVNSGVSVARNVGMKLASNQYVAFLDADDEWLPDFLLNASALIKDFPDNPLYGYGYQRCGESPYKIHVRGIVDYYEEYCKTFKSPLSASSVIVDKFKVSENLFPAGYTMGEDLAAWMMSLKMGRFLVFDSKPLVIYHSDDVDSAVLRRRAKDLPCFLNGSIYDFSSLNATKFGRDYLDYHRSDYLKSQILFSSRTRTVKEILKFGHKYYLYIAFLFFPKVLLNYFRLKIKCK